MTIVVTEGPPGSPSPTSASLAPPQNYKVTVYWKKGVHPKDAEFTRWEAIKKVEIKEGCLILDDAIGIPLHNVLFWQKEASSG